MKNLAVLMFCLFFVCAAQAEKKSTVRVEVIDDGKDLSDQELRRRLRRLQDAVIELQDRVDYLELKVGSSMGTALNNTCYIETPFDGVFDATDSNETKARVEAVKACMTKVKSRIHCSAEKVKCGK